MEKIAYAGWENCLRLANGAVELVATTDVGPRLIRFGLPGGNNVFKEFAGQTGRVGGEEWRSYGGHRFWHAPEEMPRSYAPDNEPVAFTWDGKQLRLTQAVERLTGLQKEIEVTLHPSRPEVRVVHRLFNRNLWAVEVAPWALTVMQGPGTAIFPHEPATDQLLPVRPMALWGYTDMKDPRYDWGTRLLRMRCDPAAGTPQKIGFLNTAGWAAYQSDDLLFIKRFSSRAGAAYPDFGCNTECYTRGDMLEVETLGPLAGVPAGGSVEHVEQWHLSRVTLPGDEMEMKRELEKVLESISPAA